MTKTDGIALAVFMGVMTPWMVRLNNRMLLGRPGSYTWRCLGGIVRIEEFVIRVEKLFWLPLPPIFLVGKGF